MEALLQAKNITKIFPGVKALDHVDLDLYPGEVHILAGENGAGKSTLVKCILGVHQPDQGQFFLAGDKVDFHSPQEALAKGIGAVYQELTMVPWLNAAENIFFNREPRYPGGLLINHRKMKEEARSKPVLRGKSLALHLNNIMKESIENYSCPNQRNLNARSQQYLH